MAFVVHIRRRRRPHQRDGWEGNERDDGGRRVRNIPRLSLSVDHIASSSPFPSPGSPFIPPPRLSAHEFALRTPLQMRNNVHKKRPSTELPSTPASAALSPTMATAAGGSRHVDDDVTPTTASMKTAFDRTGPSPPTTPTPSEAGPNPLTPPATPKITIPEPMPSPALGSLPDVARPTALNLSRVSSQRDSLTSSRPAPPSPALSRRTSAALSRRSSTRSRRASRLPAEASASAPPTPTPAPEKEKKRKSFLVKIRDFAFSRNDDRHVGKGVDVPRPNRVRRSTASTSSTSSNASGIPEDEPDSGWGSFRWNTLSAHLWPHDTVRDSVASADAGGPSRTDFERNFDVSSPSEEVPDPYQQGEDEEEYVQPGEEGPLVPGIYRAMFAFEPEGTAEMALEEEQIVRIIGRGGGVGWAIVENEDGGHALVPESYLELVQAEEGEAED
ncbi:uncharacterized protein B0H18DRAFT_1085807 [Fomitopsis serialis]|uniref:uncharacterized protein n=1 Tax=Fomitopsis serialis TaxID=139415 RepID=UPI002007B1C4|nr:uncharacterized protein B0H18DRAFT_1085807 [Neoantrodia serialis]KAH9922720.1 hypothetical protein B0H18DRAFT_1085807 [Neoantrodia serialis]